MDAADTLHKNPVSELLSEYAVFETRVNTILSAPTGSGKTHAIMQKLFSLLDDNSVHIFLVPLRSLALELFENWHHTSGNIGLLLGGFKAGKAISDGGGIFIMTPEKYLSMLATWQKKYRIFSRLRTLVVDEIHLIESEIRGNAVEKCILFTRLINPFCQIIAASGTLGKERKLAHWLDAVRLDYPHRSSNLHIELRKVDFSTRQQTLLKDVSGEEGVLVFVHSRLRCEEISNYLSENGINSAFHHAGLNSALRSETEANFRAGTIDVLCCTPTLESGLNLPVKLVILYDISFFGGQINYRSLHQRLGRAGRGSEGRGYVYFTNSARKILLDFYKPFDDLGAVSDPGSFVTDAVSFALADTSDRLYRLYLQTRDPDPVDRDIFDSIIDSYVSAGILHRENAILRASGLCFHATKASLDVRKVFEYADRLAGQAITQYDLLIFAGTLAEKSSGVQLENEVDLKDLRFPRAPIFESLALNEKVRLIPGIRVCVELLFSSENAIDQQAIKILKTATYLLASALTKKDAEKEDLNKLASAFFSNPELSKQSTEMIAVFPDLPPDFPPCHISRLERSLDLRVSSENGGFIVRGGMQEHFVTKNSCDCPDFENGYICKHILAVHLFNPRLG
ncbi:DEAD/DEAH box helicase [Myxococcota bacterium]|nr:DEAD/DEAH box helicase [Myxococcota bacterium]MBU1380998.1 DEAD/DEAH box helicase [Myxococcota bacterium]MBU1496617.1 DEAD/DEAH box helicase [Myxococcota bacterium]